MNPTEFKKAARDRLRWTWAMLAVAGAPGAAGPLLPPSATGTEKPLVLLTAFEPFGGRPNNLSLDVARGVQARASKIGKHGAEIWLCRLPVVYDGAAEAAENCFRALPRRPTLVLSLGEGSCDLRLETSAQNLDNTAAADNAGVTRKGTPIEANGPAQRPITLPVETMFCSLPSPDRQGVRPSTTAGNYVCNNTAYLLGHFFQDQDMPYGFIHVPPASCGAKINDPSLNSGRVARMLGTALKRPHAPPIPFSIGDVQARLSSSSLGCDRTFYEALLKDRQLNGNPATVIVAKKQPPAAAQPQPQPSGLTTGL